MSRHRITIIGQKFGRLTVREQHSTWTKCDCDCGTKNVKARSDKLKDGSRVSCGCVMQEKNAASHQQAKAARRAARTAKLSAPIGRPRKAQGIEIERMKAVWGTMMQRCHNASNRDYPRYGGRGITVCAEWHNRDAFLFSMSGGYRRGLWIERQDNDYGYEPDNCIWATPYRQSLNRVNTLWITRPDRPRIALSEWARKFVVKYSVAYPVYARLAAEGPVTHDDMRRALHKPV